MRVATPRGEFSVRELGGDAGDAVLLLHPLASSGEVWRPVGEWLGREGRTVLALDARGHGDSSWDGGPFTVEDMAADAAAVLDALGFGAVGVVGMSMGGCTALALALSRPDLVSRLVLADTTACYGPDRVSQWEQRAEQAETSPREALLDFQLSRWFTEDFRSADPAECDRVAGIFVGTSAAAHAAACRALGAFDVTDRLAEITAEALVLVGEEDYATPPAMAQALATRLPKAELQVLPRTRHLSMVESRDTWQAAEAHLEEHR
jgi:3-oxoadipate enol-lactonase